MSKRERARHGKFSAGIRGRSAEIAALKNFGWTWDMVAAHFFNDVSLGNATGDRFSQEWSRQKRQGMLVDEQKSSDISEELLKDGSLAAGRWVFSFEYETRQASSPDSRFGSSPLNEGVKTAKPSRIEPDPSPPAAPVDNMAVSAIVAAEPTPIEFSPEGMEHMQAKLRMGIFRSSDFAELLGFPKMVCEVAYMEAKREPRDLATLDRLVGRLVFSKFMKNDPEVRGFISKLPGASRWESLMASGIQSFETAARQETR